MPRHAPRIALAWIVLLACPAAPVRGQTWTADNGNGTFSNPLFFDEFSDPDLIRVGNDFYMTGTTMHSMPGLPILHSRDLVNWRFLGYALDRLDLGPEFRLDDGKAAYGQGIWAPSFRHHNGTFYIFSNVNNHTTQLFRATNPAGPWTRTPMKRSLHDISVLFDDDGKVYAVWGYRGIRIAELTPDLLDLVPGSERELIPASAGMGEGVHVYKIRGMYYLTSAWFTFGLPNNPGRSPRTWVKPRTGAGDRPAIDADGRARCVGPPAGRRRRLRAVQSPVCVARRVGGRARAGIDVRHRGGRRDRAGAARRGAGVAARRVRLPDRGSALQLQHGRTDGRSTRSARRSGWCFSC